MCDDILLAWEELDALVQNLTARMGREAPGLTAVRESLGNCRALGAADLAEERTRRPRPRVHASAEDEGTGGGGGGGGGGRAGGIATGGGRRMLTRADVYARLSEAAALLQQMEPHSPVPYLIQRAIALGSMQFPELMKNLITNAGQRPLDR